MSMKKAIFYHLSDETFQGLRETLKDIKIDTIGDASLNKILDEVWDSEDKSLADEYSDLFILLNGFESEADLKEFVAYFGQFPELNKGIIVVRTEVNANWLMSDLFKEVGREHYLMKKVMALSKMLKKTSQMDASVMGDTERKLILNAFMVLQKDQLVEEELDKAIKGLVALGLDKD